MELPIVLGKLFLNNLSENSKAGALFGDTLNIVSKAVLPSDTIFKFDKQVEKYINLNTPKKLADALLEITSMDKKRTKRYKTTIILRNLPAERKYNYPVGTLTLYTLADYTCKANTLSPIKEKIRDKLRDEIYHHCDFNSKGELVCTGFFGEFFLKDGTYAPPSENTEEIYTPCTLGFNAQEPEFYIRLPGEGGMFDFSMANILEICSEAE